MQCEQPRRRRSRDVIAAMQMRGVFTEWNMSSPRMLCPAPVVTSAGLPCVPTAPDLEFGTPRDVALLFIGQYSYRRRCDNASTPYKGESSSLRAARLLTTLVRAVLMDALTQRGSTGAGTAVPPYLRLQHLGASRIAFRTSAFIPPGKFCA